MFVVDCSIDNMEGLVFLLKNGSLLIVLLISRNNFGAGDSLIVLQNGYLWVLCLICYHRRRLNLL